MNFLCPACRTPLPRAAPEHVTCSGCGVAVDLTRMDTAPGQARLWPEIDLSGENLSGHALLRLLGSGGMGSVYEARTPTGDTVALKVLSPLLAAEPALRERFRREARALSAITHPGVVKMLGEGEENGFCWYAMERVTGQDLRERLKSGPLPAPEVIELGKTMLDALQVVHAAGFVHRDVKPSNILLSPTGPKLCDFGIARLEGASTLTESAALLGSLRYMAPEQRWGKSDERSDLYALGVVLHEALALGVPGERPLPPGTPTLLTRAITRLTEASAALRPQSAVEAKRLLLARSQRPLQLASAALLCLVAGSAFFLLRPQPVEPTTELTVDAGPMLIQDAGAVALAPITIPDASVIEVAASDPPDAGFIGGLRGTASADEEKVATPLPTKSPVRGPTKKPISKVVGFEGLGTSGPKGKTKKLSKPEAPDPPGVIVATGVGAATVFDGKTSLGDAPGQFTVALGGHAIFVVCKEGGKRQTFKLNLSSRAPSQTVAYECPEGK